MDYNKIYTELISKARAERRLKNSGVYYESHHITPKSCGGTDEEYNLVLLTWREHILAHRLLCKVYSTNKKHLQKMKYALRRMLNYAEESRQRKEAADTLMDVFVNQTEGINTVNTFLSMSKIISFSSRKQNFICGLLMYASYTSYPRYLVCRTGSKAGSTNKPCSTTLLKECITLLTNNGILLYRSGYGVVTNSINSGAPSIICLTEKGRKIVDAALLFSSEKKSSRYWLSKYVALAMECPSSP